MDTILVTAIGSFSSDAVIKLSKTSYRVVGCDIYPKEWVAQSMDVDAFYKAPYASKSTEYISFILDLIKKEDIKYIIPLTDAEVDVLNKTNNRRRISEAGAVVCISDEETIDICRDKFKFYSFLTYQNLGNPIESKLYEGDFMPPFHYPIICKPVNGRSSQGLRRIHAMDEYAAWRSGIDKKTGYVIQPEIEGDIVTVDVVCDEEHGVCVAVARKELLRTLNGAGTSVEIIKDETLTDMVCDIAKKLHIKGCVNMEFICDAEGTYHILECNPRFSGGVKFSCMAGYDMVINHLRCFKGEQITDRCDIKHMYIARKYEEYITSDGSDK